MLKTIAAFFPLMLLSLPSHAEDAALKTENYLVISGRSHHFAAAPRVMGRWNERNTGLSYQRVYLSDPYRYSGEVGFFKDSYGKPSSYLAGAMLYNLNDSPRISVGGMLGLSYRTNSVYNAYYKTPGVPILLNPPNVPGYGSKEWTPMAGLVVQVAIPETPIVLQTTFVPKAKRNSSAVMFGQMLLRF